MWVVIDHDYGGVNEVFGPFASKEAAISFCREKQAAWRAAGHPEHRNDLMPHWWAYQVTREDNGTRA